MKIKNVRMPVMAALSLAVALGLVGCAGAYPAGLNANNSLGYPSQDAGQSANNSGSSYGAPGNQPGDSSVPGTFPGQTSPGGGVVNSLTPGAPYALPNPNVPLGGSPYPMPNPNMPNPNMPNPDMPNGIPMPVPQPNMPPGIIGFFPPEGLQVCPTPHVAVTVQLSDALRIAGAIDLSKVSLTLDGQDILSQVQLIAPMVFPQTHMTLLYQQKTPLAVGPHQVKLTYAGPSGPLTLTWNFTVANIACQ